MKLTHEIAKIHQYLWKCVLWKCVHQLKHLKGKAKFKTLQKY